MTDPKRIFISHATVDDALVDAIAKKLEPHTDLWIDHKEGLSPSDPDWEYALRIAIQSCDAGVFIMTENALNSKVCKSECLLIQSLGKPLYVIRAQAVEFKDIWLTISLIQYADWAGDADKAITAIIHAINGESGADIPTPARKFTNAGNIHRYLPYLSNPLRGREKDVAWIQEHLGNGVTQIIATGGMGKSRLCAEIALNYTHGAVWFRCDIAVTSADLQIALREHADLPEGTPFATTQATIIQRKPLLVVDNAETVPDHDRPNYVTILSALAGGGVPILLTSRKLWREFKPPIKHELGFLERAQGEAITRDFATADNLTLTDAQIRELAGACRHYPRLIEFAIGQLTEHEYTTIIRRLNKLSYDTHEDMQEALDEMITQTVAQMATENHGADADRLLRRLTWLTATVPKTVIIALKPDDMDEERLDDALALLRRYQFVRYDADKDRYAIAVLVREALGTDPTAFNIYADFYTQRAEQIFDDTPIQHWADKEGGANFDDVVNIKALGSELMRQTQNGTMGDLARALEFAVMSRRYVTRRMEAGVWDWLEMGLNAVRALRRANTDNEKLIGHESLMLSELGAVYSNLGDKQKALIYLEQALSSDKMLVDITNEAIKLNGIGLLYSDLGDKPKALEYMKQSLSITRMWNDKDGEATALNNIGLVYSDLGDNQNALMYYNEALSIMREVGDRNGVATTLNNIGGVYDDLDDKQKALVYYEQALPIMREVGDRGGEATTLNNIGMVYQLLGRISEALTYYEQALPIDREVGDRWGEATTLNNIGGVYQSLGQINEALSYYEQALPILQDVENRNVEAVTCFNIGKVYEALGDLDKAIEYVERCVLLDEQVQHPDLESDRRTLMALKRKRGDADIPSDEPQQPEFDALIAKLADIYRQAGEEGLREMLQQSNVPDAQIDEIITVVIAQVAGQGGDDTDDESADMLPFETIQQWVQNTYAVLKQDTTQLDMWRGQLEGAKSQMSGMGDDWQNEAQFVDALLAVLRGEKPSLPESHPYHEPVRQLVEALG